MAKLCDHVCVGVVVLDEHRGQVLMIERATPPIGVAPVAGHLDDHGNPYMAAIAELQEEVGIDAHHLGLHYEGAVQRSNVCRRRPSHRVHDGHLWHLFTCYTSARETRLKVSQREVKNAYWYTRVHVQALAEVTANYARDWQRRGGEPDEFKDRMWERHPGIEPVWMSLLSDMDYIRVSNKDLKACDALAGTPPRTT